MLLRRVTPVIFILLVLFLSLTHLDILIPQVRLQTETAILNAVWDRVNQRLITTPNYAVAQGSIQSITTIFNDVLKRNDDGSFYLDMKAIGNGDTLPATCVANESLFRVNGNPTLYGCDDTGTDWITLSGGTGGGSAPLPTGIQTSAAGLVESLRYEVVSLIGTCALGTRSHVNIEATTNGVACPLPDASLATTPGVYHLRVTDANFMTLTPFGTNTINGVNAPLAPVKGPLSMVVVERVSDTAWHAVTYKSMGYGSLMTNICAKFNGTAIDSSVNTNTFVESSLTCPIPAGELQAGAVLKVCTTWHLVTSGTPPAGLFWDLVADSTSLTGNGTALAPAASITGAQITHCSSIVVAEDPSASSDTYTGPYGDWSVLNTAADRGGVTQPVALNTTTQIVLKPRIKFTNAGTATTTIKPLAFIVEATRLGF